MVMFLPRIVKKGMFGDGLLYASMARNMADGVGSFWKPFFSSSYWLENIPTTYYENPPLMLWLQSLVFRGLGDHWWVEKIFCAILLLINIFLFRFLWNSFFANKPENKNYWYFVVFWWYLIPVAIWGNVNNLMDNLLLSFCLGAVGFLLKSLKSNGKTDYIALICAAICIFCGLLTKGPVAMYPLALPFIYYIIKGNVNFIQKIKVSLLCGFMTLVLFGLVLLLNSEALNFFTQYWEQRLKAVIVGNRDDMKLIGLDRMYILLQLSIELLPTIIVIGIVWLIAKIKRWQINVTEYRRDALFFILVGFSATLPILLSTKQSGIYLIPGIPMFSMAAAIISIPFAVKLLSNKWLQAYIFKLKLFFLIAITIVILFSGLQLGKPGREIDLIHDIEIIKKVIPEGSKIGVCQEMKKEFVLHTYLQRMAKYELTDYIEKPDFYFEDHQCLSSLMTLDSFDYQKMEIQKLKYFKVFRKIK